MANGKHNEMLLDLGFDPTESFHRYGFRWTAAQIDWYVDGNLVHTALHTAFHSASNPTPKATESLQKIMVNAWPVDETAALWAGRFNYPGTPLHAGYQWVRHIAGADCSLADALLLPHPLDRHGEVLRRQSECRGPGLRVRR